MNAAVYYDPGDIRIEDRPMPKTGKYAILAKVKCCAICGTDLKIATIGNPRCHPPRIIGHEFSATIVETGKEVRSFQPGDRITMATTVSCGQCNLCRRGLNNLCASSKPISYDYDGAFAEYISIPGEAVQQGNVIKLTEKVSDDAASLCEPLSCAINSQEISGVKPGDSVLVVGGGPLGAIHAELAKANGAGCVMMTQRSEPRLSMLKKIKGVKVLEGTEEEIQQTVMELTDGMGADHVIVCAPSREAQEKSLDLARKGGSVNLFASLPKNSSVISIDSRLVHYNELRISGASDSRPEHVRRAVELIASGAIRYEELITHRLALDDLHKGFDLMKNKQCLKVLVYPGGVP